MAEKRPIISTGGRGPVPAGKRRSLPMAARYVINALLVLLVLVVGELMIDGGAITRYQTSVLQQVGVYIIMAVSLNVATGYLGQLPLGHAGFMSVGAYGCAIFIMRLSEALGIGGLLDVTVSGEECAASKPAPDVYLRTMELLGVEPGQTLVVEDSPIGILAAHRSGARVCAMPLPEGVHLDQSLADVHLSGLTDVLALALS